MRVVQLGQVRNLLANWDQVRAEIVRGGVTGFQVTLRGPTGKETIYLGGHYEDNHEDSLRAALAASWEMTKTDATGT